MAVAARALLVAFFGLRLLSSAAGDSSAKVIDDAEVPSSGVPLMRSEATRGTAKEGALTETDAVDVFGEHRRRDEAEQPSRGSVAPAGGKPGGFPYPDVVDASSYCGSTKLIDTCGFAGAVPLCATNPLGIQKCYTGLCVCTAVGGCMEPTCTNTGGPCTNSPVCNDGRRCITLPGTGWSCWHPCNLQHQPSEYGPNAAIVSSLRESGQCEQFNGGPVIIDPDLHLDDGINLKAEAYPFFTRESAVNAGGPSRRRYAAFTGQDDDTSSSSAPAPAPATPAKGGAIRGAPAAFVVAAGAAILSLAR